METTLGWIAIGIGAAGTLLGITAARGKTTRERSKDGWITAGFVILGAVILFLPTLLKEPPFAYGQRLGYGILLGGLIGAVAGLYSLRMPRKNSWGSGIAAAALPAMSLLGVGLIMMAFPEYPQPALGGFIIGSLLSTVLFKYGLLRESVMDVYGLTSAALGGTVMLAVFRYDLTSDRFWWRAPMMIIGAAIVAQIVAASTAREGRRLTIPAFIASIITLGLIAVFTWKVFPKWPLLYVSIAGVGTFALAAWLASVARSSQAAAGAIALAVVAMAAVGFRMLGGFGVGIAILAGWSVLLPVLSSMRREETESEDDFGMAARAVIYAAFIGVGVLFYRLYLETYVAELRGPDFRAHYTLVALTLGAISPFLLLSFFPISLGKGIGRRIVGAGAAGFFAALIPLAILMLWGFKASLGFLAGTIAAEVFALLICTGALRTREESFPDSLILVLAAQVSALQFSGFLASLIEMPRMTKVIVLAGFVLVGLVWMGISALMTRGSSKEG